MAMLDCSNQGRQKLEITEPTQDLAVLVFDNNNLTKIENLENCLHLQQLSIGGNALSHIAGLQTLEHLQVLNLPCNNISSIAGIKTLVNLRWINLSGNRIKVMENLQSNVKLEHLDLSDNCIAQIGNISFLENLKALLLHGNNIAHLRNVPNHLPKSVTICSLAENDINDLNEVAYLSGLPCLEQMSIMNNPCVLRTGILPEFDYRPFAINWCLNLRILDGVLVTEKEGLKAEWLYSQGKGRHFKPGEHVQLIRYLAEECPLTSSVQLSTEEEVRLSRVLQQHKVLQQSVEETETRQSLDVRSLSAAAVPNAAMISRGPTQVDNPWQLDFSPRALWAGRLSEGQNRPRTAPSTGNGKPKSTEKVKGQAGRLQPVKDTGHHHKFSESQSGDESSSMLDAETEFLPVDQEYERSPMRPNTAPSKTSPTSRDLPQRLSFSSGDAMPTHKDAWHAPDLQEPVRQSGRPMGMPPPRSAAVNFPLSPKLSPRTSPRAGSTAVFEGSSQKTSSSPVTRLEFRHPPTSALGTDEESDSKSQTAIDLKIIKSILGKKKSGSSVSKPTKPLEVAHPSAVISGAAPTSTQHVSSGSLSAGRPYTPENYRTPTRRSLLSQQLGQHAETAGHSSSPAPEVALSSDKATLRKMNSAAVKIQAFWRGYFTRTCSPLVLHIRDEIRSRRAEQHIQLLEHEVQRHKDMYEKEKQLRSVQLEVLKCLWNEVENLRRSQVSRTLQSDEENTRQARDDHLAQIESMLSNASIPEEVFRLGPKMSAGSPQSTYAGPSHDKNQSVLPYSSHSEVLQGGASNTSLTTKEEELEKTCAGLQRQVNQLHEVLASMSNYVFQGGVLSADKEESNDAIRLSLEFNDGQSPVQKKKLQEFTQTAMDRDRVSTDNANSSASAMETRPPAGIPTTPSKLWAELHGPNSIVLHWRVSEIYNSQGDLTAQPILGYRIYVNGQPKGLVAGTQSRALLEGLQQRVTYRLTLRAVSALGDSEESRAVHIRLDGEGGIETDGRSYRDHPSSPGPGGGRRSSGGRASPGPGGGGGGGYSSRHARPPSPNNPPPGQPPTDQASLNFPESPYKTSASVPHFTSTPKSKTAVAQMENALLMSPDSGYLTHNTSSFTHGQQFRTFPPSSPGVSPKPGSIRAESPLESDKTARSRRTKVSDKLARSQSPSVEVESPEKGEKVKAIGKSKRVHSLLEKGLLSEEDILKYVAENASVSYVRNKSQGIDYTLPLKALKPADEGTPVKQEEGAVGKPQVRSPTATAKDIASTTSVEAEKPLSDARRRRQNKQATSTGKPQQHQGSKLKVPQVDHPHTSGSDSCSPQVSPSNTSSGMSMGGTTGSDSSGGGGSGKVPITTTVSAAKPELRKKDIAAVLKRNSGVQEAAGKKVQLTKPKAPPVSLSSKATKKHTFQSWADKIVPGKNLPGGHKRSYSSGSANDLVATEVQSVEEHATPGETKPHSLMGTYVISQSFYTKTESPETEPTKSGKTDYSPSFYGSKNGSGGSSGQSSERFVFQEEYKGDKRGLTQSSSDNLMQYRAARRLSFVDSSPEAGSVQSGDSEGLQFRARQSSVASDNSDAGMKLPGSADAEMSKVVTEKPPPHSQFTVLDDDDGEVEIPFQRRVHRRASARESRQKREQPPPRSRSANPPDRPTAPPRHKKSSSSTQKSLASRHTNGASKTAVTASNRKSKPQEELVPTRKPPTGRSPSPSTVQHQSGRRRTVSEQSGNGAEEETLPGSSHSRRSSAHTHGGSTPQRSRENSRDRSSPKSSSSHKAHESTKNEQSPSEPKKSIFKQKLHRTGSDLGLKVLPDRPESPSPKRPPNTPQKAPSSPRPTRSSSFSRALPKTPPPDPQQLVGDGKELLRQNISLEVLQAVKSKSQEMLNQMEQEECGQGDAKALYSFSTSEIDEGRSGQIRQRHASGGHGDSAATTTSNPLRRSGSLRDDRLISVFSGDVSPTSTHGARGDDSARYSPKLTGKKGLDDEPEISKGQRRIKLGNKAADLFAKLSVKLNSSGKN